MCPSAATAASSRTAWWDLTAVKPIARLGNMDYTVVETIFTMHRPVPEDLTPPEG